ncbi:phosphatidylglycerophosphatase A [Candidatus Latescibacterota bacterium]
MSSDTVGNTDRNLSTEPSYPSVDYLARMVSSGIFAGYFPVARGTFSSLLVIILYFLLSDYLNFNRIWIFLPFLYFLGVWSASRCEVFWGKDNGRIVIDEIVGMLVTVVFLPLNFKIACIGFFLFRAFDIFKPPPIRRLESLPRGWGVMTDDLVAGIYANLVLRFIIHIFPWVT